MINRDSWGHSYLIVRGEIIGFFKDELMRKHLPRMFSLKRLVQILVVVAIIQMRTLKAEVEKDSVRTAIGHG